MQCLRYFGLTTLNAVLLKHMYNLISLSCPFLKKQIRKWYAKFLRFELHSLIGKKVQIAQISLNILTPIPREDTNHYHPLYPSENLATQLHLMSHMKKIMCAYTLSTKLQYSCICVNSPQGFRQECLRGGVQTGWGVCGSSPSRIIFFFKF